MILIADTTGKSLPGPSGGVQVAGSTRRLLSEATIRRASLRGVVGGLT
jgi:hypothetical protein